MNKENVVYIHNGVLFSHKEGDYVICRKMDGTGGHCVKQNKPGPERQMPHVFSHIWNLDIKKNDMGVKRNCLGVGTSGRRSGK
jgi:hypothetical protein